MATKPDLPISDPQLDPKTGEFRVIAPGYTFKSVTDVISRIVLTPHTPMGWFFGFMVVAGEWFSMWESKTWNGEEAAFRFYAAVLAVLILLNQPDPDLPGSVAARGSAPKRRWADKERPSS